MVKMLNNKQMHFHCISIEKYTFVLMTLQFSAFIIMCFWIHNAC